MTPPMTLKKAVQIAVESIHIARLKISFDAGLYKRYNQFNERNRVCAELYDKYTDAIALLNSLVTEPIQPGEDLVAKSDIQRDINRRKT